VFKAFIKLYGSSDDKYLNNIQEQIGEDYLIWNEKYKMFCEGFYLNKARATLNYHALFSVLIIASKAGVCEKLNILFEIYRKYIP
jgi:hypothetical protein